ncbi:MAG: hypothetical protein AB7F65_02055 [Dehalococcoidia bacterium]
MLDIYVRAKREAHYNATRFLQMVAEKGGLATAHQLLALPPSDGFGALWAAGRVDLTVEALVLRPEFRHLFSDAEVATAAERVGSLQPPAS